MRRFIALGFGVALAFVFLVRPAESGSSKDSYLKKTEAEVQSWADKIKELQERSIRSGAHTRDDVDRQLKVLDEHLSLAKKKLEALRGSSEGHWTQFRKDMDGALVILKKDYRKAVSFFKKDEPKEKS